MGLGDISGDGKPDLAVADYKAAYVTILMNATAAGANSASFAAPEEFLTGVTPGTYTEAVTFADMNGDGKPDLVAADGGAFTHIYPTGLLPGSISILLNTMAPGAPAPSFTPPQTFAAPVSLNGGIEKVTAADISGDGPADLILTSYQDFYLRRGYDCCYYSYRGSRLLPNTTAVGETSVSFGGERSYSGIFPVALADINGDGQPDLIAGSSYSAFVVVNESEPAVISGGPATGTSVSAGVPASLTASSGATPQSATTGDTFANPLSVQVLYADGAFVEGAPVTFTAPASGPSGTFPGGATSVTVESDVDGFAVAPPLTANSMAGSFTVTASCPVGTASPVPFDLTNDPLSDATSFQVTGPTPVSAGSTFTVTVTALDSSGEVATSYTGTVHFSSSDGQAVLPADYTFIAQDDGVQTFSVTLNTAGTQSITATDTANNSVTGSFSSRVLTEEVISISNPPPFGVGSSGFDLEFTVTRSGGVGTAQVQYATENGTAQAGLDYQATSGTLSFGTGQTEAAIYVLIYDGLNLPSISTFSVVLSDGSDNISGSPATGTIINENPPASLTDLSGTTPQSTTIGSVFATPLGVLVQNAAGDPVPGAVVTFTAPASGPSADFPDGLTTYYVETNFFGEAVAPTLTANASTGSYVVSATAGGAAAALFDLTNETRTTAVNFSISAPDLITAGGPFSVTVTALDQFGSVFTGYTGTLHFLSSDPQAGLPADATLVNGVGMFTVDLRTAGSQTITVTDTASAGIAGGATVSVNPAAASTFTLIAPTIAPADTPFDVTITAFDPFGNFAANYDGTVHFTSSDFPAELPADSTLTNGTGTFSVTLGAAGPQTINATDKMDPAITGVTSVVVGSASSTVVMSSADPSFFGQPVTFTAMVSGEGNGIPTGTVTFMEGATTLGTGILSGTAPAIATYTITLFQLPAGTDQVTAVYSGDAAFAASTSAVLDQTVNQAGTITLLTSSPKDSVFGQAVTFTATVSSTVARTPTGTVILEYGATTLGTAALSGGSTSLTCDMLPVGTDGVTAVYGGDANFAFNVSAMLTQTVSAASTTITVSSGADPSAFGQAVTFTAMLTIIPPGTNMAANPTGTVTFYDSGVSIGEGTLSGTAADTATFTTSVLSSGTHAITVSYSGDGSFAGSAGGGGMGTLVSLNALNASGFNAASPIGDLAQDANGDLFGTSESGAGSSTIFEVPAGGSMATTLASFTIFNGAYAVGVIRDESGDLFGETQGGGYLGGEIGYGTVFELPAGSGTITDLASFGENDGNYTEGFGVFTGEQLAEDPRGDLFGTTASGTVFEIAAGSATLTTIASFGNLGDIPMGGLIEDGKGDLFGTTLFGGSGSTVFEVPAGSNTISILATFNEASGPVGGLIEDASGNLFGVTQYGGTGSSGYYTDDGVVFEVKAGSGAVTTLAAFDGANGTAPIGGLIEDARGDFFGTTSEGGAYGDGTLFELPAGSSTITTLVNFNGADGRDPQSALILGHNGELFGSTTQGGASGDGTIFEFSQALLQTVIGPAPATAVVVSSANHAFAGQAVTFTVSVSAVAPNVGTPTGTVSLLLGHRTLGQTTLDSSGEATITISNLGAGEYMLQAYYAGSADFTAARSPDIAQTVVKDSTTTTTTSSSAGGTVTFMATVSANPPGIGPPAGSVAFLDDGVTLGRGTLTAGTATFTTSTLPAGVQSITAIYGGSSDFANSKSAVLEQTVQPGPSLNRGLGPTERPEPGATVEGSLVLPLLTVFGDEQARNGSTGAAERPREPLDGEPRTAEMHADSQRSDRVRPADSHRRRAWRRAEEGLPERREEFGQGFLLADLDQFFAFLAAERPAT